MSIDIGTICSGYLSFFEVGNLSLEILLVVYRLMGILVYGSLLSLYKALEYWLLIVLKVSYSPKLDSVA